MTCEGLLVCCQESPIGHCAEAGDCSSQPHMALSLCNILQHIVAVKSGFL